MKNVPQHAEKIRAAVAALCVPDDHEVELTSTCSCAACDGQCELQVSYRPAFALMRCPAAQLAHVVEVGR